MSVSKNLKVVVDTNLFISALIRGGLPFKVVESSLKNKFTLTVTEELFQELISVLMREKIFRKYDITATNIHWLIEGIKTKAHFVEPLNNQDLPIHSRDPKDDPLLACSFASGADYLVTGDEDLLTLKENPKLGNLKIVTAGEFVKLLK